MRTFEYLKPTSTQEALSMLAHFGDRAKVIAGGTDLIVQWKKKLISPDYLISLRNIPQISFLDFSDGLRIGSATSHRILELSSQIRKDFPIIYDSVSNLGSVQVRNSATIGGNLCNAAPSADSAPPMLALEAVAKIASAQSGRTVPLERFFTGPGRTVLRPDEIVTEFVVPKPLSNTGMAYWKYTRRRAMDLPVLGVAVLLSFEDDRKTCRKATIALGVAAPTPMRALKTESFLQGKQIDGSVLSEAGAIASREAAPRTTIRGSEWYRREMIRVLVKRAGLICKQRAAQ